ncbi:hypothetical protein OCU04_000899 [Sclerotinia nivalis]|uniref:Uncharacterized protein n=1 Tax=Sclerotinia nivalis TaxID=352851 RepID=A0A9X0AXK6_9HELO|nr:hypothetical protein OCU04_000899 [Sclerotinia nivalis]
MKTEIFDEMNDLIRQGKEIFDAIEGIIDLTDEALEVSTASVTKKVCTLQNDVKARDMEIEKLKKENYELRESLQKCNHEREQMKTKAGDLESARAGQMAKVKNLEDWRIKARKILTGEVSELLKHSLTT